MPGKRRFAGFTGDSCSSRSPTQGHEAAPLSTADHGRVRRSTWVGTVPVMTSTTTRPTLGSVILRMEAIADGLTDRDIGRQVRDGTWHRLRHGAYCDGGLWRALPLGGKHMLLARAVVRQARTQVVLSHASAVPEYDGPAHLLDLARVDVTRRDERAGRVEAGVRQHQGVLLPHDVTLRPTSG